ncbi:hypothetical protein EV424DRAFT_499318 [Suillus variegatus]|nr:hypothetical protein EV424DRAFT_499318 [Suillus variegatus]
MSVSDGRTLYAGSRMRETDVLRKGLRFYHQLTDLSALITLGVRSFITDRRSERGRLVRGGAGARHH